MLEDLLLILMYMLLGAGIKYIDQAYDIGVFNKKTADFAAIPCGILMGYLIVTDPSSATILLSVFLGVAVTSKIDNIAFYLGVIALILTPVLFHDMVSIVWIPFGLLTLSGIIDEVGNDWSDNRRRVDILKEINGHRVANNNLTYFFDVFFAHRFSMKVMMLLLCLAGYFRFIYFLVFLSFDVAYILMEKYSLSLKIYNISRDIVSPYYALQQQAKTTALVGGKFKTSSLIELNV